jgi:hypothetical protein
MNRNGLTASKVGLALLCSATIWGQDNSATSAPPNENGAATFYFSSGASFGLPADQAFVVASQGSIVSPRKTVLPNVGLGATVRVSRFVVPFVDFTAIDAGKAAAQVGFRAVSDSGQEYVPFQWRSSANRVEIARPAYVQFGGGMLHSRSTATFTFGSQSTTADLK